MLNASQRAGDGYMFWDGTRWWWYNDHDGPGAGTTIPAYGQGRRHYFVDTGFDAVKGSDQNYQEFMDRVKQYYPTFAPFVEIGAGGALVQTGGNGNGNMTGPVNGSGGWGGGNWLVQGDVSDLVELVGKFIGGISATPTPPPLVSGDDVTNFNNLGIFMDNLTQHARRDELIRLAADGIGLALNQMSVGRLNIRDLSDIVAEGIAALSKLPDPPPVADLTTGLFPDGTAATTDQRFSNLFTYLVNEADYWKRDELIRAFGKATKFVLSKRA